MAWETVEPPWPSNTATQMVSGTDESIGI